MRILIVCLLAVTYMSTARAHHPDRESQPVHQRVELIGPIGNRLPMSYRRRYNRPTNLGGRIAYYIAPSSQEAMRWHIASHQGQYKRDSPRMVAHYFYPKPWEAIRVGARPRRQTTVLEPESDVESMSDEPAEFELEDPDNEVELLDLEDLGGDLPSPDNARP